MSTNGWPERFEPVDDDPLLPAQRSFARLFEPESGIPDAALLVSGASAYLVRPSEAPRLVHADDDVELLFGALAGAVPERTPGEWREIPPFVPRALLATSRWVVTTACLHGGS